MLVKVLIQKQLHHHHHCLKVC